MIGKSWLADIQKQSDAKPVDKTVWDLTPLFSSDEDPNMARNQELIERKNQEFIVKWKGRSDYLEDPLVLKEALDDFEVLLRNYGFDGSVGYYFWLRTNQDENSPVLKAKFNKIKEFARKIENDIQFFQLKICKIPQEKQGLFLDHPSLALYKHYLEVSFRGAKYTLSEPEERILRLKYDVSREHWVKMTSGFLSKEEREIAFAENKVERKSFSEILHILDDSNKKVRDGAAAAFNDILQKHVDTAEAEINAILEDKKISDDLRGFSRPDQERHISDDIETEVVDTMLASVSAHFDIPQRYYQLKAKLLGLPKLAYHERNVLYGAINKSYSYDDTVRLINQVFTQLDPAFAKIQEKFVKNSQIDVYPRKNKRSGAFCVYGLMFHPTYILLNHTGQLEDVLTLAHELGHGINNEYMKEAQHALYFSTPLATAEVASTFMEDFVLQELLKESNEELRLALLMKKLGDEVSTIFRQVACYRFEQALHAEFRQKGYVSKSEIGTLFLKHMASYMGPGVEQSPGAENWWVYWSHIRSFFYVYSYASGLLISKSLQSSVRSDPAFINKVKRLLGTGCSESPKQLFSDLGIDITQKSFWEKGISEIDSLLTECEQLAGALGKI